MVLRFPWIVFYICSFGLPSRLGNLCEKHKPGCGRPGTLGNRFRRHMEWDPLNRKYVVANG